jgi:hypothetical protein
LSDSSIRANKDNDQEVGGDVMSRPAAKSAAKLMRQTRATIGKMAKLKVDAAKVEAVLTVCMC